MLQLVLNREGDSRIVGRICIIYVRSKQCYMISFIGAIITTDISFQRSGEQTASKAAFRLCWSLKARGDP